MPIELREANNVEEFKKREVILARIRKLRTSVQLDINTIEHWNRTHPDEAPISSEFERAVLAYLDGDGPLPSSPTTEGASDA